MGTPKDALRLGGDTLLGRTCAVLRDVAERTVAVARDPDQALPPLPPDVARTHDAAAPAGPLAGIAAGLAWLAQHAGFTANDAALVVACDHPFLAAPPLRHLATLLGDDDLVLPEHDGVPQPLCAVYRLALRPAIDALLRAGTSSPRALAARVATRVVTAAELRAVDPRLQFLQNVNTPAEWESARRERGE